MLRSSVLIFVGVVLCGCPPSMEAPTPHLDVSAAPPGTNGVSKESRMALDIGVGAELERITIGAADELYPAANGDGSVVLFQEEKYDQSGPEKKLVSQLIYGSRTAKPGERELYTTEGRASSHPSFAPDGSGYAFITNALGPLALVHTQAPAPNAALTVIVSSDLAPEPGEPAISPDGKRVAFSLRDKSGGRAVAVIGIAGDRQTRIGEGRSPAWSPDGKSLVFVRTINAFNHVFRVESTSFGELTQLTQGSMDCDRPTFSPDGRHIAFASNLGYEALHRKRSEVLHLYAIRSDGTGLTQLTHGTAKSATPSWGRDGWLYFTSDREGSLDIYRMKPGELAAK